MDAVGIVAEYNPFHKGHLLHLEATKKYFNLPTFAVMSGSFMQRGEPAFCDKWLRARMAVDCGVDLVLELPTAFSLRSAEFFASGAVQILQATGLVQALSCGAEDANVNYLQLAKKMLEPETQEQLHAYVGQGLPYAKACELALGVGEVATKPNNILALEYAKALLKTDIKQYVVSRVASAYNDEALQEIASATAVRMAYKEQQNWQQAVPKEAVALLEANKEKIGYDEDLLWKLLCLRLRTCTSEQLLAATECKEGLENVLLSTANASSLGEAIAMASNKRYPASRIRRLLMQLLLNKSKEYFTQAQPAYLKVLAFNDTGRELLAEMKKKAELPIITKVGRAPFKNQSADFCQQLELDITASDVVAMLRPQQQNIAGDFLISPYYKQNLRRV